MATPRRAFIGTIEKGKLADLLLLDANPLDAIVNMQKIRAVVANGRILDRTTLDQLLVGVLAGANGR